MTNAMKNLTLKIKSYQEDVTYTTIPVQNNLSNEEIIALGKQMKLAVDLKNPTWGGSPNIIRFENEDGIYNDRLNQLVQYKK
jgi:hypothetical protein